MSSEGVVVPEVVAVYGVDYEAFRVEYFEDETGEWSAADGGWPQGVKVSGFYTERRLAESVAKHLAKVEGRPFRVVRVSV